MNLIKSLLTVDVQDRIEWDMFFYHPWFLVDDLMIEENNLMDFSMSNGSSLPNLDKIGHHLGEKKFASFRHNSIKMRESSFINSSRNSTSSSNKSSTNQPTNLLDTFEKKTNNLKITIETKDDYNITADRNDNKSNQTNDMEMNFLESLEYSSSGYTSCDDNHL